MGSVTLVTGGARSGKSAQAMALANRYPAPLRRFVIATGQGLDDEMRERIARHRATRPADFETVEEPLELGAALSALRNRADIVVLDCLTLWISNLLGQGLSDSAVLAQADSLASALQSASFPVVVVSARSVESARRVLREGTPELVRAVERDDIAVSLASQAIALPAAMQKEMLQRGHRALRNAVREHSRAERFSRMKRSAARSLSDMGRRFAVLYADPPWSYEHVASNSRAVENHYPTMKFAELAALPLAEVAAPDCVLFMWATVPKLAEAIDLMRCWGFEYRSAYVWDKQALGMGYWSRVCHENLLIGVRGNPPAPPVSARRPSIIRAKRAAHSSKPESVRSIIDALVPGVPKLKLFARGPAATPGWEAWGNEVTQVVPAGATASATDDTAGQSVRAAFSRRRDDHVERSTFSGARAHGQANPQGRTARERVRALS